MAAASVLADQPVAAFVAPMMTTAEFGYALFGATAALAVVFATLSIVLLRRLTGNKEPAQPTVPAGYVSVSDLAAAQAALAQAALAPPAPGPEIADPSMRLGDLFKPGPPIDEPEVDFALVDEDAVASVTTDQDSGKVEFSQQQPAGSLVQRLTRAIADRQRKGMERSAAGKHSTKTATPSESGLAGASVVDEDPGTPLTPEAPAFGTPLTPEAPAFGTPLTPPAAAVHPPVSAPVPGVSTTPPDAVDGLPPLVEATPPRPNPVTTATFEWLSHENARLGHHDQAALSLWAHDLRQVADQVEAVRPQLVAKLAGIDARAGNDALDQARRILSELLPGLHGLAPSTHVGAMSGHDWTLTAPKDTPDELVGKAWEVMDQAYAVAMTSPSDALALVRKSDLLALDAVLVDSANRSGDTRYVSMHLRRALAAARLTDLDRSGLSVLEPLEQIERSRKALEGVIEPHELYGLTSSFVPTPFAPAAPQTAP